MTTITDHGGSPIRGRPYLFSGLFRLIELGVRLRGAWDRRRNLRALEALPADTLKDIGWPTSDTQRIRIVRK